MGITRSAELSRDEFIALLHESIEDVAPTPEERATVLAKITAHSPEYAAAMVRFMDACDELQASAAQVLKQFEGS